MAHAPTLFLLIGYPGAGKTTTAKAIHELTGAVHISSDATRTKMFPHPTFSQTEHDELYKTLDRQTEAALREGKDVIYDANLNRYRHRKEKYEICERTGAKAVLLWVQTPRELAKTRAVHESRSHLWPKEEAPQDMFERIAKVIEPPRADEPHIDVDGTKVTTEYMQNLLMEKH
jgi:predicted kinase